MEKTNRLLEAIWVEMKNQRRLIKKGDPNKVHDSIANALENILEKVSA